MKKRILAFPLKKGEETWQQYLIAYAFINDGRLRFAYRALRVGLCL